MCAAVSPGTVIKVAQLSLKLLEAILKALGGIERAVAIDKFLEGKKSFISHIVHDELVLDISDDERQLVPDIKLMFSENKLDTYMVNVQAGKNYYDLEDLNI